MFFRRKLFPIILLLLLITSFLPVSLFGSQFLSKRTVTVSQSDTLDDDIYVFSNYGKVNGRINGDFTAFCYDINLVGEVGGNANLGGYRVDLRGKVDRSARLVGSMLNVNGDIGGNVIMLGNEMSVGEKAVIKRDLTCAGQSVTMDGNVAGNLNVSAARVVISGTVEGDVDITADKLLIVPPAVIKGTLHYISRNEATIENGTTIQGEKTWKLPEIKKEEEGFPVLTVLLKILLFLMALITGLMLMILFKEHTREASVQLESNFWVTLAIGCLTFMICTAGAIISILVLIGIPMGMFLISVGMILFYIGKVYVSITLGRLILRLFSRTGTFALFWEFLLGLIILTILFQVPYLGWVIYIATFLLGMGAAVAAYFAIIRRYKAAARAATPAATAQI
jgi:cytoskeletal protein CcmA (bactofilin family)